MTCETHLLLETVLSPTEAFALHHYLDSEGFSVSLHTPLRRGALGEIPFLESPYEIWLHAPHQLEEARLAVRCFRHPSGVRGACWTCSCGETHEPEFRACWRCGKISQVPRVRPGRSARKRRGGHRRLSPPR